MKTKSLPSAREVVKNLTRSIGQGAIMLLGDHTQGKVETLPTGSLGLDEALGVGGIPIGRMIEIYGPEASGKTTLTLSMLAQAQKRGHLGAFIDAEHALDPDYAKRIGVDVDNLLIAQPDSGEEGLGLCERLIRETPVRLIVIDSVAALIPQAEVDGDMGDVHMGLQARLMSQALRKLAPAAHKHNTTVIFINQLRMKIGNAYGPNETTPGGRALRFYTSVRLDVRRIASIKHGDVVVGSRVRVKTVKNKVAPPHKTAEFGIVFGRGIDRPGELLDRGLAIGICQQHGSWFSWNDVKLGQGRQSALQWLIDNPSEMTRLQSEVSTSANPASPSATQPKAA